MSRGVLRILAVSMLAGGVAAGSETDALSITANIQARHLPFGTIVDPIFAAPDSNQIVGYTRCGDSAIWTGHYLAAEAFRYKVTQSPDALANVKAAVAGLQKLVDVTGTDLLARCAVPLNSPYAAGIQSEEQHNGIHINSGAGLFWVGNTSRDQYLGAFFGLGVAYDMVTDAALKATISSLATRMLNFLMGHAWTVFMPDGTPSTTFIGRADQQLTLLQIGRHVNPNKFSTTYDVQKVLLSVAVLAPIALEVQSNDSYFKFNLDSIDFYNLIRLEGGGFGNTVYEPAYNILRNHTAGQQNAFFNMIDRGLSGPDARRDAETVALLDAWLQRPRRDLFVDLRGQLPSCNDPNEACSPVPVPLRPPTDFLWQRSPFQLSGGGSGVIESAGIDYILPYWMARYYNVIGGATAIVVSSANGRAGVAAEAIASFFGSSLAADPPASAGAVPLPTTLDGVSIQVKDSAGNTRPAPLYYVSSKQINFEVPAGTAAGTATFTVTGATGAIASATANVQNVAPGIFTADGTGSGVAAALAIHVFPGGQMSTQPIFQCSTSGCVAMPINLGIDTPTYLALFGTGLRNRSSLSNVSVTIHGVAVPVQYAGPQGFYPGLDQINVPVTLNLRGSGDTDVVVSVDGQAANTVRVNIQ